MRAVDHERLAAVCGLLAPAVALGAVLLSALLATPETFTWRERALSDLGRYGAETFWLFNGGLILGGLFGLSFAWRLRVASETRLERIGAALLAVATLGLIGVGAFFLEHTRVYFETDLHGAAALVFFALSPFSQWVYGTGMVLAARARRSAAARLRTRVGLASIWLGIAHPISWLAWLVSRRGAAEPWAWFALPEIAAAFAFGGWVALLAGLLGKLEG